MLPKTLPGDIILSSSKTWLSKTIRFVEAMQTGAADRSHLAVCIGDDQCIEALLEVSVNDLKKYEKEDIEIWRLPLLDEERVAFRKHVLKQAGANYGGTKLGLFLGDACTTWLLRKFGKKQPVHFFTKNLNVFPNQVCSQFGVGGIYATSQYRFRGTGDHKEVPANVISPDYCQDLMALPHNRCELIYKQATNS